MRLPLHVARTVYKVHMWTVAEAVAMLHSQKPFQCKSLAAVQTQTETLETERDIDVWPMSSVASRTFVNLYASTSTCAAQGVFIAPLYGDVALIAHLADRGTWTSTSLFAGAQLRAGGALVGVFSLIGRTNARNHVRSNTNDRFGNE